MSSFNRFPTKKIDDIETFLKLEDYKVVSGGNWKEDSNRENRKHLTLFLWSKRKEIQKLYKQLDEINSKKIGIFEVEDSEKNVRASLDLEGNAYLSISGKEFRFKEMTDWGCYLCGKWLEEYCYLILLKCIPQNELKDMRIGIEITWDYADGVRKDRNAQEFDIILTMVTNLLLLNVRQVHG